MLPILVFLKNRLSIQFSFGYLCFLESKIENCFYPVNEWVADSLSLTFKCTYFSNENIIRILIWIYILGALEAVRRVLVDKDAADADVVDVAFVADPNDVSSLRRCSGHWWARDLHRIDISTILRSVVRNLNKQKN